MFLLKKPSNFEQISNNLKGKRYWNNCDWSIIKDSYFVFLVTCYRNVKYVHDFGNDFKWPIWFNTLYKRICVIVYLHTSFKILIRFLNKMLLSTKITLEWRSFNLDWPLCLKISEHIHILISNHNSRLEVQTNKFYFFNHWKMYIIKNVSPH